MSKVTECILDYNSPKGFIYYNFLDAAWDQLDEDYVQTGIEDNDPFDHLIQEVVVKEEGYAFVFVSNEHATQVDIHFDDLKVTHSKSNVIQYNEYYPFGHALESSWTRENTTGNDYLYNAGSERNSATGNYEMLFREYDPILGRMNAVDPMSSKYSSLTPYNYSFNDPVYWNDPNGDCPDCAYSWYPDGRSDVLQRRTAWLEGMGYSVGGGDMGWYQQGYTMLQNEQLMRIEAMGGYNPYGYWIDYESTGSYENGEIVVKAQRSTWVSYDTSQPAQQTQGGPRVIMGLDGNVTRFDDGANLIYVNTADGLTPLHDRLVRNGTMTPAAFSNALLNIVKDTKLPKGQFDVSKLYNGQISIGLIDGTKYNGGFYNGQQAGFRLVNGSYLITYQHINGPSLTVDSIRSILGIHEYYAHGVLGLIHPRDNAIIESLMAGYPYR